MPNDREGKCWLTMTLAEPVDCIGEDCMGWGYKQCAIAGGLNTLSFYINQHLIQRGRGSKPKNREGGEFE